MAYPKRLVSRIKGALAIGFTPKQISRLTGISVYTLREWKEEAARGAVAPDPSVVDDIRLAFLKEN